jgi:hypothetical protein
VATVADSDEVLDYIERHRLYGKGVGYVDVHLLAAVALTERAKLWTRDKRLMANRNWAQVPSSIRTFTARPFTFAPDSLRCISFATPRSTATYVENSLTLILPICAAA